jgi:predicted RNA-binding Zn ribbon-like protein
MTLQWGSGPASAAWRAVELVDVVERCRGTDGARVEGELADVFARWDDPPDEALHQQIDSVIEAIDELAGLFDITELDVAARRIDELLRQSGSAPRLVHEPSWGWHLHVDPPDADWATWLLASSALGCATRLAELERVPWGRCAADGCRRPFLDRGRREPQRFCSATCATRERVRRHRAG